jgi:hypothetical protein
MVAQTGFAGTLSDQTGFGVMHRAKTAARLLVRIWAITVPCFFAVGFAIGIAQALARF